MGFDKFSYNKAFVPLEKDIYAQNVKRYRYNKEKHNGPLQISSYP